MIRDLPRQNVVSVLTDLDSPSTKLFEPSITKKALAVLSSVGAFFAKKSENGLLHLLCKDNDDSIYTIAIRPVATGKYILRSARLASTGDLHEALNGISGQPVPVPDSVYKIVFKSSPVNKFRNTDITGWGKIEGMPLIKHSLIPKRARGRF